MKQDHEISLIYNTTSIFFGNDHACRSSEETSLTLHKEDARFHWFRVFTTAVSY